MTASEVPDLLVSGIALGVGVLGLLFVRRMPAVVLATWLAVVCLVPIWVVVPVGPLVLEPQAALAWGCLIALLPLGSRVPDRLTTPDLLMVGLVVTGLAGVAVGEWAVDAVFRLLVPWSGAYLLGRLVWRRVELVWVYRAIALAFGGVALLALAEFATGVNPFIEIPGSSALRAAWTTIQVRGGVDRAEGAFGHSIALGSCLATAVPIALAARLRPLVTVCLVTLIAGATVVTFSRLGMIAAALGLVLALVFLPSGLSTRLRLVLAAGVGTVGVSVLPLVSGVFGAAGEEASGSAAYRGDLLPLLGSARWVGLAESAYRAPDGRAYFGTFRSIDNALLLLALNSGLLALLCVVLALVIALGAVVTRRATAPTIALAAQVPGLVSVALITQYGTWVWFLAGLAVASQVAVAARSPEGSGGLGRPAPPYGSTVVPQVGRTPSCVDGLTTVTTTVTTRGH